MTGMFDRPTLDLIDRAMEVEVETVRPDGSTRITIVWPIVDGSDVFIRSWRGERAYWYQAARESPDQVTLHVGGRQIPVRAIWAADDASVLRCSRGLEQKYAGDASTPDMVRPSVLGTTMRLEPR